MSLTIFESQRDVKNGDIVALAKITSSNGDVDRSIVFTKLSDGARRSVWADKTILEVSSASAQLLFNKYGDAFAATPRSIEVTFQLVKRASSAAIRMSVTSNNTSISIPQIEACYTALNSAMNLAWTLCEQ